MNLLVLQNTDFAFDNFLFGYVFCLYKVNNRNFN